MELIDREKKLWREIWALCVEVKGRGWQDFREKNKSFNEKMKPKGSNLYKKVETVIGHVNRLIAFAEKIGVIKMTDRDNHIYENLTEYHHDLKVEVLPVLPNLRELTKEVTSRQHKKIRILDNWMSYLLLDENDLILEWVKCCDEIEILLLHPDSPQIAHRFNANKLDRLDTYRKNKKQAIDCLDELFHLIDLAKIEKGYQCKIEVRLYDDNPGLMAFVFDDVIFYGNFLSIAPSQRTFFHKKRRINRGHRGEVSRQINKHFETLWKNAIECDRQILSQVKSIYESDDQNEYTNRNQLLQFLEERYALYTPDDPENPTSKPNRYQRSILTVDRSQGTCQIILTDRFDNKEIIYEGTIRSIGLSNLLFRVRRKDFFISLLVHLGKSRGEDNYQGIYIHSDLKGYPIASQAILLPFSKLDGSSKNPTREDEAIDGNIKRFFATRGQSRLGVVKNFPGWDEFCEKKNPKEEILDRLIDKWSLYYPFRYPQSVPPHKRHEGSKEYRIAQALFEIRKDNEDKYECFFKAPKEEELELEGKLDIIEVNNQFYLSCTLERKEGGRTPVFLQLIFLLGGKNKKPSLVNGMYNIVYVNGTIGSGIVTMIKEPPSEPKLIDPFDRATTSLIKPSISNLVSEDLSSLLLTDIRDNSRARISQFQGTYKLYTYVRKKVQKEPTFKTRGIAINRLEIFEHGQVRFDGVRGITATGRAFLQRGENLYIDLKNVEVDKERSGYIILKVDTSTYGKKSIFCGIFAGLGMEDVQPLAKRVIIERTSSKETEEFDVEKIALHSVEIEKIPSEIRTALTGRIPNYIGFQRLQRGLYNETDLKKYNKETPDMGEVFFHSAIYQALKGEKLEDAIKVIEMLDKAILHGFDRLKEFESEIANSAIKVKILGHPDYKDLSRLLNP